MIYFKDTDGNFLYVRKYMGRTLSADDNERLLSLRFLKSLVAPKNYVSIPPRLDAQADVLTDVTVLGNFTVTATNPVLFQVPTNTGIFTWHVLRGSSSIARHAQVPNSIGGGGHLIAGITIQGSLLVIDLDSTFDQLIMYDTAGQPTITPRLEDNFTFVRFINGYGLVESSTTSLTSAALSGLLHAGSWSDTRDGWRTSTGPVTATGLAQFSVTKQDGFTSVPAQTGIVGVGGSDLAQKHSLANPSDQAHFLKGAASSLPGGTFFVAGNTAPALTVGIAAGWPGHTQPITATWLSPWGITCPQAGFNFDVGSVGVYTQVGYSGMIETHTSQSVDGGLYQQFIGELQFTDIYAFINSSTNLVQTQMFHSHESWPMITNIEHTVGYIDQHRFNHSPPAGQARPGLSYIGTLIEFNVGYTGTSNDVAVPPISVAAGTNCHVDTFLIVPVAENLYGEGELGPCRLWQYEQLAVDQIVTYRGMMRYGCITGANLAPYVQTSASLDPSMGDIQWLPIASMLFNSTAHWFKRMYDGEEYNELINRILPGLTAHTLRDSDVIPHEIRVALEASGIFDTIAQGAVGALGGALGGMSGGPEGMLQGALTGGLQRLMAPGQFGVGPEGAGQFAAGQFGESAMTPSHYSGAMFANVPRVEGPVTKALVPLSINPSAQLQQQAQALMAAGMMYHNVPTYAMHGTPGGPGSYTRRRTRY